MDRIGLLFRFLHHHHQINFNLITNPYQLLTLHPHSFNHLHLNAYLHYDLTMNYEKASHHSYLVNHQNSYLINYSSYLNYLAIEMILLLDDHHLRITNFNY